MPFALCIGCLFSKPCETCLLGCVCGIMTNCKTTIIFKKSPPPPKVAYSECIAERRLNKL